MSRSSRGEKRRNQSNLYGDDGPRSRGRIANEYNDWWGPSLTLSATNYPPPTTDEKSSSSSSSSSDANNNVPWSWERAYETEIGHTTSPPATAMTSGPPPMPMDEGGMGQTIFEDEEQEEEAAAIVQGIREMAIASIAAPAPNEVRRELPAVPSVVKADAWRSPIDKLKARYKKIRDDAYAATRFHGRDDVVHNDLKEIPRSSGRDRYEAIQSDLNDMGLIREKHQIQFHNSVLDASVAHIYGADYQQCLEEIFARTNSNEIRQEILVQTPRRFGKTTMVAMIVAALAARVPGIKIGIFSTALRTSQKLMEEVKRFLACIPGTGARIMRENKEELWLSDLPVGGDARERKRREMEEEKRAAEAAEHDRESRRANRPITKRRETISKVYSYAASERTTRGFTVDITILEEAAHMSENIFNYVVVPAMGVANMVLLAITTPQDPTNYFSRLTTLTREDGQPFFHIQALGLACNACLEANRAQDCTHMQHLLPAWKTEQRQERIKAILADNDAAYKQEALGLIVPIGKTAFDPIYAAELRNHPLFEFKTHPQVIYSFIDPHGGGAGSSQAIVDLTFRDSYKVVSLLPPPPPPPLSASPKNKRGPRK